jgi:hypothetical protein
MTTRIDSRIKKPVDSRIKVSGTDSRFRKPADSRKPKDKPPQNQGGALKEG